MASPRAWRAWPQLRAEIGATARLAVPLALTQLGQILIHGTEVLLLGRLSPEKLASVTVAWALFHVCFIFASGVVQATAPLAAAAKGARQPRQVRKVVRQGLWMTVALTLPLGLVLWNGRPVLAALGQDPRLLVDTEIYLRAAVVGLPLGVGFVVLRNFVSTYNRTRPVLVITALAVVLNVPVSWALIFGQLGMPRLEVLGAGIGAAASWAFMFVALLAWCTLARPFRRFGILARAWRSDWRTFKEIGRVGLPIGWAMVLETGLFAATALMMGRLGAPELAAHQVTLQIAAMAFMVPLGIGIAATIRIGIAAGAGDADGVRRAGWVAVLLGGTFMTAMAVLFWTLGDRLVALFFDPANPATPAALAVAVVLIKVAAAFQLADGIQVIGISALRGLKDTAVPMWLAALGYWGIGFPACLALGFLTPLGSAGVWIGLELALGAVAVVMLWRFARLTAQGRLEQRLAMAG